MIRQQRFKKNIIKKWSRCTQKRENERERQRQRKRDRERKKERLEEDEPKKTERNCTTG